MLIIWIAIAAVAILSEFIFCTFISSWMATGAACAVLFLRLGASLEIQIFAFMGGTFFPMYFLRPYLIKFLNLHKSRRKNSKKD